MIYLVAAVAAIAGFLFGFDEGVIAGALGLLRAQFAITPLAEGLITAAVPLGALFGAIVAGRLADPLGRRGLLMAAAMLFMAGAGVAALAGGGVTLAAARLVLGLAIGMAGMAAPLYISESAPAERRGMLVSVYQLAITLGILGAYLVNFALADSWRLMFLCGVVPGLALLVGMYKLADTPRWLALKGREGEARDAIARIRAAGPDTPAVDAELAQIQKAVAEDQGRGGWRDLTSPAVRPAVVVGMGLFFLQQLSGINAVIYYAPTIFDLAGFASGATQLLATIGIGLINVGMTVVGMALIDRLGRRRLLVLGFVGTAASLAMIAIGASVQSQALHLIALVGIGVYIASFAISVGPLPHVMMSEIFPLNIRGLGMSLASISNWGFNFLVVFSFPVLVEAFGLAGVFTVYAIVCALGVVFTLRFVPETKGVSLEAIERHLHSGRPLAELGGRPGR